jgi:hypothetical protein
VEGSDPESRQLLIRNRITEVADNARITLDYKVTNENDSKALGGMLKRAKVILGHTGFTALFDKGYHRGSEISKAILMGVKPMVAVPGIASFAPDVAYNVEHFVYDPQQDTYTCPQNNVLTTNGNWYVKSDHGYVVKHYKTPKCQVCCLCPVHQEQVRKAH